MDEPIGFLPYDLINRRQEIIVDLLLAQVHAAFRVQPAKRPRDRDGCRRCGGVSFCYDCLLGVTGYKGGGEWSENAFAIQENRIIYIKI